jgi:hypothetical protein
VKAARRRLTWTRSMENPLASLVRSDQELSSLESGDATQKRLKLKRAILALVTALRPHDPLTWSDTQEIDEVISLRSLSPSRPRRKIGLTYP